MTEKYRFILFTLVLVLLFDNGILENVERSFIEKITEEALKLPFETGISQDYRLVQEKASKLTIYKQLRNGKEIFRSHVSDAGKDVIVLEKNEDHLKTFPEKRIYTVLTRNPGKLYQYSVFFAYIRNAFPEESDTAIKISGKKYKIEWDMWDHRRNGNVASLFGWTTCSRSLFMSCKNGDPKQKFISRSILLAEDDQPYYSKNSKEESGILPGNSNIMLNFYPSIDYDETETALYFKTIRLATLSEAFLKVMRPSLKRVIKKYGSNPKLAEQVGILDNPDNGTEATEKIFQRTRTELSKILGKTLRILLNGLTKIGDLALRKFPHVVSKENTFKGAQIMKLLMPTDILQGEDTFRTNPNPGIIMQYKISAALQGKNDEGPFPILKEIFKGDYDGEAPLAKLIDIQAMHSLIENVLPTFRINRPTAKHPTKYDTISFALTPKSKPIRVKREEPEANQTDQAELMKTMLAARKAKQEEEAAASNSKAQEEQMEKLKLLLAERTKAQAGATPADPTTSSPIKTTSKSPKDSAGGSGGAKKKTKSKKESESEEKRGGGGGGGFLGGLFGRKKRAIRKRYENLVEKPKTKTATPRFHSVSTQADFFSNLGWISQDMAAFSNEVGYLLNSGTFSGWGPCKHKNITKGHVMKAENVDELVELLLGLMRTHCDPKVRERVDELINGKYIEMTNAKTIAFGTKALEIMKKPKLNEQETEKMSISFEIVVFSQTILDDLTKFQNYASGPELLHSKMNKNAFALMQFALNALKVARSQALPHYLLLTRNTAWTIQTAIGRIVTDLVKISYLPLSKNGDLVTILRQKSFDSLFNLIGIMKFYLQDSQAISDGNVSDGFKKFMLVNSELVRKSMEHFTTKIKWAGPLPEK